MVKNPLSDNEYQIMELLWRANKPLSKRDIIDSMPVKGWKESSIYILINSLLDKKMIEISGFVQSHTNYGRTFIPSITKEAYLINILDKSRKEADLSVPDLVSGLIDSEKDVSVIRELEDMISAKLEAMEK